MYVGLIDGDLDEGFGFPLPPPPTKKKKNNLMF